MGKAVNITILTPTYNRVHLLPRLYESLRNQTNKNFQWLIIDDGSTDGTKNYIKNLSEKYFSIEYHHKKNGGKHTALNYASQYIQGAFVCIADSDDYLTVDAIQTMIDDWEKYQDNEKIGVISYQRAGEDGHLFSKEINVSDYHIDDEIHFRINRRLGGDRCEVFRAEFLQKHPFPIFSGEKFMSEGWFWHKIAEHHQTVYRKKVIYICKYLEGGLTKSGRVLRMKNPLGMMENCKSYFLPSVSVIVQIKEMLLYGVYAFCSTKSIVTVLQESNRPIKIMTILPFSYLLYLYWLWKYKMS